jgi:hypothetical protein
MFGEVQHQKVPPSREIIFRVAARGKKHGLGDLMGVFSRVSVTDSRIDVFGNEYDCSETRKLLGNTHFRPSVLNCLAQPLKAKRKARSIGELRHIPIRSSKNTVSKHLRLQREFL